MGRQDLKGKPACRVTATEQGKDECHGKQSQRKDRTECLTHEGTQGGQSCSSITTYTHLAVARTDFTHEKQPALKSGEDGSEVLESQGRSRETSRGKLVPARDGLRSGAEDSRGGFGGGEESENLDVQNIIIQEGQRRGTNQPLIP